MRAVSTAFPILVLATLGLVAAGDTSKYLVECGNTAAQSCPSPAYDDPNYKQKIAVQRQNLYACLCGKWTGGLSQGPKSNARSFRAD
ncbi:hypothetical protein CF319_g4123 [Tilletia indica]|uniref:Uncharacterized protein n=1 Tax=Tilletia indica TaxID=43049 RepID=A0A8T8TJG6_9BASI|nr:hypothetical protein CF319_g4123 [Tilletia indica]KAE8260707.1 hypothetical protein A4X13_0g188 [Tilletia indica]